jgi:hypothetical protein
MAPRSAMAAHFDSNIASILTTRLLDRNWRVSQSTAASS